MKIKLPVSIAIYAVMVTVMVLGLAGCADEQESQQPAHEVASKFEEGITGKGKLIETDPTKSATP